MSGLKRQQTPDNSEVLLDTINTLYKGKCRAHESAVLFDPSESALSIQAYSTPPQNVRHILRRSNHNDKIVHNFT